MKTPMNGCVRVARHWMGVAAVPALIVLTAACGNDVTDPTPTPTAPTATVPVTPTPTPTPTSAPTVAPPLTPTPAPPETSERASLAKVELRTRSGELVPYDPDWGDARTYSCPTLECAIWVYVASPGLPSRTILVETPSRFLSPPRATRVREDEIPAHQAVRVHMAALDASTLQMASGVYAFEVRLSETSDSWGVHTETATVRIDFD